MNDIAKKKFEILNYTQSDEFNINGLAEKLNELTRMCDDSVLHRELLIDFLKWVDKDYDMGETAEIIVGDYIKIKDNT